MELKTLENIKIIPKGTWREETILGFVSSGDGSYITAGTGDSSIEVTTIDKEIKEKVTFIKMDIEGSELESLHGASKIIRRDMPKLAICCYHKKDDIITLYNCMKNIENQEKEYRIYLRHHSNSSLYAIPVRKKKRLKGHVLKM